jgi:hypothetical protein
MTAVTRVVVAALVFGLFGSPALADLGVPAPASSTTPPHPNEVWRLHPTKKAARAATLKLRITDVENGDGGALMVVEDRHIPTTALDTADNYGFAYAELANGAFYPRAYVNAAGIGTPACPLQDSCMGLNGSARPGEPLALTFAKPTDDRGRPASYDFHDFYVGALHAKLSVVALSAGWTVSRATDVSMVMVQNSGSPDGVGVQTGNYSVEQFNGEIAVKTPNALWSAAYVGLPCSSDLVAYPVPQGRATFTGLNVQDSRRSIPLSCAGAHTADGMASGPTTWRLTSQPTGTPDDASGVAPTQNLNRMVVLIVNRPRRGA